MVQAPQPNAGRRENDLFFWGKKKFMPKYWGKQIFSLVCFPEVAPKQKTEKKEKQILQGLGVAQAAREKKKNAEKSVFFFVKKTKL